MQHLQFLLANGILKFFYNKQVEVNVGIAYNDITNNAPGVTNSGYGDYGYLLESGGLINNTTMDSSYGSSLTTGDVHYVCF